MATHTNGRADLVGSPIQLGDFLPERREVVLNGQHYSAWVTSNRRFPRSVQAQLDTARNRYLRAIQPLLGVEASEEEPVPVDEAARTHALEQAAVAYARYVTDALLALVPGLGETEADLIDADSANRLLVELGYFEPPEPVSESEADQEDAAPLTGDSPQPDSPASTLAAVRDNS